MNKRKMIMFAAVLLAGFWLGNQSAYAWRTTAGHSILDKLSHFSFAAFSLFPSFHPKDLLCGLIGGALLPCVVALKRLEAKKYRSGREYGSARWATAADIKPFVDPVFQNNIILTATERITMNGRPIKKGGALPPNKNILVVGGSGSGKTRFFVKPNLMQMHSSYVVTDPKGSLILDCGRMLEENGYQIKFLNLIDLTKSMHYNPFMYIKSEEDVLKLVNVLIANTSGGNGANKSGDSKFFEDAERLYYMALIGCIMEAREDQRNFSMLLEMLEASHVMEDNPAYRNPIDRLFERLEQQDPKHFAVRQYKKFKLSPAKTMKNILISCGARMAPFDIQALRDLTSLDELALHTIGDRKNALFVMVSDTDSTFSFVAAIMYSQLFDILCHKADQNEKLGYRLPVHVRLLLDEFANIGQIPNFERIISVIRSREISACIILQAKSQLKALYKDHMDTIVGNCDTELFLGGQEKGTIEDLSKVLGKETIDSYNHSNTRGNNPSHGMNYQKLGRELMTQDELLTMGSQKCILRVKGIRPFFSQKYDLCKHPNYKLLADADSRRKFNIKAYLKRTRQYEVFEVQS